MVCLYLITLHQRPVLDTPDIQMPRERPADQVVSCTNVVPSKKPNPKQKRNDCINGDDRHLYKIIHSKVQGNTSPTKARDFHSCSHQ